MLESSGYLSHARRASHAVKSALIPDLLTLGIFSLYILIYYENFRTQSSILHIYIGHHIDSSSWNLLSISSITITTSVTLTRIFNE